MNADKPGICAGCGAKYPGEVKDLFTRPGTTDEYCQDCAGMLMLSDYLLASQKKFVTKEGLGGVRA